MANYIFLCDVESKRLVRKREREKKKRKERRKNEISRPSNRRGAKLRDEEGRHATARKRGGSVRSDARQSNGR